MAHCVNRLAEAKSRSEPTASKQCACPPSPDEATAETLSQLEMTFRLDRTAGSQQSLDLSVSPALFDRDRRPAQDFRAPFDNSMAASARSVSLCARVCCHFDNVLWWMRSAIVA